MVRRGVIRAIGAYIFVVWALAVGLVDLLPAVGFPDWAIRVFLGAAVAAIPVVGIVAWKYDLTLQGFLPDKLDVARRAQKQGNGAGPTTRVSPQSGSGRSLVEASWTDETGQRREMEFDRRFQVGRDLQADIRILDDRVSRRHMEVYPVGDQWFIRDLSSLNGTYVDNAPVEVLKLEKAVKVSLDRSGPQIALAVRAVNDTMLTNEATRAPETAK
jgi:pSer/pThr/pTyr-binding forkhead associated (FHA) protein